MTTQPAHQPGVSHVMTNGHLDEPRTVHGVVALRFDFGPATMDWRVVDPFRSIRSKRA